tara:strand:+ start:2195 stop:4003 length:1809 start_codon:yes stop_codon:yes gene_type:complete
MEYMFRMQTMKTLKTFLLIFSFSSYLSSADISDAQQDMLDNLPPDQRSIIMGKMEDVGELQEEIDEFIDSENSLVERPEIEEMDEECEECIYGYNFFKYSPSTFAPMDNASVPSDYILGPGDLVKVNLYGSDNSSSEQYVTRGGELFIPNLGPVSILGLTFKEAKKMLQDKVKDTLIGTQISISLKELRSISVYLLGEAYQPGQYVLSGLSTVTNTLFISGGVNENGSLRNIQIKRNGKVEKTYDFYDLLLYGNTETDLRLQDGDVIFIPFIENKIRVGGSFKRPAIYEIKDGDTVNDAIELAGGYMSFVPPDPLLELSSINPESFEREVLTKKAKDISSRLLVNEDTLNVSSKSGIESQVIKVTGEVLRPGEYTITEGETILDIINKAGGYSTSSYPEGAVYLRENVADMQKQAFERSADELENTIVDTVTQNITDLNEFSLAPISALIRKLREAEPLGRMVVNLDYLSLKANKAPNFLVRGGDELFIPKRPNTIAIVGEVLNSSSVSFNPSYSSQDYIDSAGGLNSAADKKRIFVIYPDGKSKLIRNSLFTSNYTMLPGSTIVVPRDSRPFDAIQITSIITPILADLATSAAAIAAISNN